VILANGVPWDGGLSNADSPQELDHCTANSGSPRYNQRGDLPFIEHRATRWLQAEDARTPGKGAMAGRPGLHLAGEEKAPAALEKIAKS